MDLYDFKQAVTEAIDRYHATVVEASEKLGSDLRNAKESLIGENVPRAADTQVPEKMIYRKDDC